MGGKMSTEEDPELRDLVAKCLESNGVLGKIRAQLRANTFLALDQQNDPKVTFPVNNSTMQQFVSSKEGTLTVSLIREFLSFFNMQFTLSVFEPESCENVSYTPYSRTSLASILGIHNSDPSEPLLHTLIKNMKKETTEVQNDTITSEKGIARKDNNNSTNQISVEEDLDVDASDLLSSEVSNIDETMDKSAKNSSLSADFVETLGP